MSIASARTYALTALAVVAFPLGCSKPSVPDERIVPIEVGAGQPTAATTALARPSVLATQQAQCDRVVADATQVFWTTRSVEQRFSPSSTAHTGHILACPVTGCGKGPTLVTDGQSHADALAIDSRFVYWTVRGFHGVRSAILKCPRTGCVGAPSSIYEYPTGGGPNALAVDASGVFWTDTDDSSVKWCPTEGCRGAPSVLARLKVRPREITVARGIVYWTNYDGSVMKCDARDCGDYPAIVGAADGSANEIVVDDASVYWTNHHFSAEDGGTPHQSRILRCPIEGCAGAPTVFFSTVGSITSLAHDGKDVYWGQRGGPEGTGILKCGRERCTPETIARAAVGHLGASGAGVFWADERSHEIQGLTR